MESWSSLARGSQWQRQHRYTACTLPLALSLRMSCRSTTPCLSRLQSLWAAQAPCTRRLPRTPALRLPPPSSPLSRTCLASLQRRAAAQRCSPPTGPFRRLRESPRLQPCQACQQDSLCQQLQPSPLLHLTQPSRACCVPVQQDHLVLGEPSPCQVCMNLARVVACSDILAFYLWQRFLCIGNLMLPVFVCPVFVTSPFWKGGRGDAVLARLSSGPSGWWCSSREGANGSASTHGRP